MKTIIILNQINRKARIKYRALSRQNHEQKLIAIINRSWTYNCGQEGREATIKSLLNRKHRFVKTMLPDQSQIILASGFE
jgi:phage terminase large subunit GpA-like protein